jgi:hypothetical protein
MKMETFKRCTACKHVWLTRERFLNDPKTELVGYQVNFENLELGFFLFNHLDCKSTIAIPAVHFKDLYEGPVYGERQFGTDGCPEYCLHEKQLLPCPEQCECAWVREVLNRVQQWPKE